MRQDYDEDAAPPPPYEYTGPREAGEEREVTLSNGKVESVRGRTPSRATPAAS